MSHDIDGLSLAQRVVLLSVSHLDADGETPAHANEVTRIAAEYADALDQDTIGKVTEAEVDRALNALEAEGIVMVPELDDTSPIGKGRPAYELTDDDTAVLDALGEDDRLAALVAEIDA
jgi:DNA-binding transcriptional ArsR family regulator